MTMTPGPWEWDWGESDNLYNADYLAKNKERRAIYRAGGTPPDEQDFPPYSEPIVQTDSRVYGPNDDDACLIAAAPKMLTILQDMVAKHVSPYDQVGGWWEDIEAIIAEATGGEHG